MPTVTGKKYPYTKKGKAQPHRAKKNAKSAAWANVYKARDSRKRRLVVISQS